MSVINSKRDMSEHLEKLISQDVEVSVERSRARLRKAFEALDLLRLEIDQTRRELDQLAQRWWVGDKAFTTHFQAQGEQGSKKVGL